MKETLYINNRKQLKFACSQDINDEYKSDWVFDIAKGCPSERTLLE